MYLPYSMAFRQNAIRSVSSHPGGHVPKNITIYLLAKMPGNPFQLLADDDEEVGAVAAPEPAKAAAKPAQPAQAAGSKAPVKAKESKPSENNANKGGEPRQRKPKPVLKEAGDVANTVDSEFEKPKGEHRSGKPKDNRQGYNRRNERQSHKAPNKSGAEKKEGHGLGNWGSTKEEIEEEVKTVVAEEGNTTAAPADETAAVEAPKDDEPKTLSFEEYKKQQASKRTAVPSLPQARQAGEGEDNSSWANHQLVKEDEDASDKGAAPSKSQRAFKKQTVSIDVQFAGTQQPESAPRDGFRGGRGGSRGGARGGRGGSRGGSSGPRPAGARPATGGADAKAPAFNIDADFPKL
eukprot:m.33904 g.33904  ORF g.33904 m.33904 type:complete len:350 (-) comp5152_c0_seq1:84-1133(-)